MRRFARSAALSAALSVVMLVGWVVPAYAGTATSNYSYFTCGSYPYRNQAWIETNASGARAGTYLTSAPTVHPAGWFGVSERLYNDSGSLMRSRDYVYTSSSSAGILMYTGYTTIHDSYYSMGSPSHGPAPNTTVMPHGQAQCRPTKEAISR
jgi:hypothetical protein